MGWGIAWSVAKGARHAIHVMMKDDGDPWKRHHRPWPRALFLTTTHSSLTLNTSRRPSPVAQQKTTQAPAKAAAAAAAPAPAPAKAEGGAKARDPLPDAELSALQALLTRSKDAQAAYAKFTQEQVDEIFKAVRGCTLYLIARPSDWGGCGAEWTAGASSLDCPLLSAANTQRPQTNTQPNSTKRNTQIIPKQQTTTQNYQAAMAANAARIPLAKMAVEETRMGVVEDKVIKNHFASEYIYNRYKDEKTCGVVEVDEAGGMTKIAEPVGVVAGIVPTTNPTSTTIFKALLCLKTRNSLVLCPHPRARKSTIAAAKIVADAAEAAGAPPGTISWVENPSMVMSQALMRAPEVSLILATGGPAMVRSAYSSGHPSVGVGAGNTPAVIDETANVNLAVSSILLSKTFDNGVICSTEQSVVVVDAMYDAVRAEFARRGAYFLNEEEKAKVRAKMFVDGRLNPDIVGQSAHALGKLFGVNVPKRFKVLIAEIEKIGDDEPLSHEKLSPLLAMYRAPDFKAAVEMADALVMFAGAGHTSVLNTNQLNTANMRYFGDAMKTVRILINTPASLGAIGDVYNFHLDPSLTLGCGSWGSTSVSTNVGPRQMLNFKSLTERRENMLWVQLPPKVYFKPGCLEVALRDLAGKQVRPLAPLGCCFKGVLWGGGVLGGGVCSVVCVVLSMERRFRLLATRISNPIQLPPPPLSTSHTTKLTTVNKHTTIHHHHHISHHHHIIIIINPTNSARSS